MYTSRRSVGASGECGNTAGILVIIVSMILCCASQTSTMNKSPQSTSVNQSTSVQPPSLLTDNMANETIDIISPDEGLLKPTDLETVSTQYFGTSRTPLKYNTGASKTLNTAWIVTSSSTVKSIPITKVGDFSSTKVNTSAILHTTNPEISNDSMDLLIIIIITVAIAVLLIMMIAVVVYCCCKRRSQQAPRFVNYKKSDTKNENYSKMDVEVSTLERNQPGRGAWIFNTDGQDSDDTEMEPMMNITKITNGNDEAEVNGNIDTSPSLSDRYDTEYKSGGNVVKLELEDDDNALNVNPLYSINASSRGSIQHQGIPVSGSEVEGGNDTMRSESDLRSFADTVAEL